MVAGYNDTLRYHDPLTSESLTLIGFEAAAPSFAGRFHHFNATAHYLVRSDDAKYSVQEIVDHSLDYKPNLEAVRSMVSSPFADDPPGTIYAGGFDCNKVPVHNTAWIYRGVRKGAVK